MTNAITKTAQVFDEATELWSVVYEAPGLEGEKIRATVPRDKQEPQTIISALLSKGANLPSRAAARGEVAVAIEAPAPIVRRASHTGWRDGYKSFVCHGRTAGSERDRVIPPIGNLAGAAGQPSPHADPESASAIR